MAFQIQRPFYPKDTYDPEYKLNYLYEFKDIYKHKQKMSNCHQNKLKEDYQKHQQISEYNYEYIKKRNSQVNYFDESIKFQGYKGKRKQLFIENNTPFEGQSEYNNTFKQHDPNCRAKISDLSLPSTTKGPQPKFICNSTYNQDFQPGSKMFTSKSAVNIAKFSVVGGSGKLLKPISSQQNLRQNDGSFKPRVLDDGGFNPKLESVTTYGQFFKGVKGEELNQLVEDSKNYSIKKEKMKSLDKKPMKGTQCPGQQNKTTYQRFHTRFEQKHYGNTEKIIVKNREF